MKPKDIFGLAVRVLGLVFLYHGLEGIPALIIGIFGGFSAALAMILSVGWPLLVAFVSFKYADDFANRFYPDSE
jgi:hypothetical protein